jgi:uncharacterized protein (DUF952 family)
MIYHITSINYYQSIQSSGSYISETFPQDGFIHCSTKDQVIRVANSFFPNHKGLLLLEIDDSKLGEKIVYENLDGGEELFPHVYGSIPSASIPRVSKLVWSNFGFTFPTTWLAMDDFVNMVK